jgi:polyisoprenoid-binding protein YceI
MRDTLRLAAPALLTLLLLATVAPAAPARWTPVPGKGEVRVAVRHRLGDFTAIAERLVGEFEGDAGDLRLPVTGTLRVPVAALRTGMDGRDRDMRRLLDAERCPEIRYTVSSVEPSFASVSDRSDVLLTIHGALAIRDVERPVTFLGRVRLRDGKLWVRGEATIKMTDFGIAPPRRFFWAVQNDLLLAVDLLLAQAS